MREKVGVRGLREEVAEVYRDLGRLGLNTGSTGNVSARTRSGMIITQTGGTAETVNADSLIAMALDGTVRKPGNAAPSSEWAMHAAIYQADPAAKAIVHTHADACTALACLNEGLPAFHYMIASFGGEDVRCAPYVTFGTPELAALATEALAGRSACLLANHGMIVHAASPRQALHGRAAAGDTVPAIFAGPCRRHPAPADVGGDGGGDAAFRDLRYRQRVAVQIGLVVRLHVDLQRAQHSDHRVVEGDDQRQVHQMLGLHRGFQCGERRVRSLPGRGRSFRARPAAPCGRVPAGRCARPAVSAISASMSASVTPKP